MSNGNNNSEGVGCLFPLFNLVLDIIRNRRIKKYNKLARGVQEHPPVPVDVLLSETVQDNIIVSGGGKSDRLHLCQKILRNAYDENHPVIVIHVANGVLENIIAGNNLGIVVNERSKLFDAFTDFDFNEIVQAVTDTCKNKYDIKPPSRYVLQVASELLKSRARKPYFSAMANCPYFKLNDTIISRKNKGAITQDTADKLTSLLLTGQTECAKVDSFFNDMKSQIEYMSAKDPTNEKAVSILSAIMNNQILCIDIRSSSNVMLLELIVNSLIIAMNRGLYFSLLIDDIAFTNNEMLKNTICQSSNHKNIIVSKDLFSLVGGKEDVFSSVVGEAEKTILFAHSSNASCEKWSKYLGEYEKIDVSYNSNTGWSKSEGMGWGYNTSDGQTETLKKEYKVRPEQICDLGPNEVFFFDRNGGYLIQTVIV